LIEANADVNKAIKDGDTPLYIASQNGHLKVVNCLIEANADVHQATGNDWTPLHVASQKGYLEMIKLLVKRRANLRAENNNGDTALGLAQLNEFDKLIRYLKNAELNKPDINCQSRGSLSRDDLLSLLIGRNAKVNTANNKGDTPLHVACHKGLFNFAKCLLENGADLNAKNINDIQTLNFPRTILLSFTLEMILKYLIYILVTINTLFRRLLGQ
jgi:ankyrin repeat protein